MFKRYTSVRQNDKNDCGAAALETVALHHRIPVVLQKLRELTGTEQSGTNLQGLADAAEDLGLSSQAVQGPYEALSQVPLPAIAHTTNDEGEGHFVVLHRVRPGSVIVADPARGVRKLSREEFCQCWIK
mgnify:FL=1